MNTAAGTRAIARAKAGVYARRGKIERSPCVCCGDPRAEMHHPDHADAFVVVWLCFKHHRAWHSAEGPKDAVTWLAWLTSRRDAVRSEPFDLPAIVAPVASVGTLGFAGSVTASCDVRTTKASGTRGARYVAAGRVRIAVTIDESMFEDLRASALRERRSIAEEMRLRLQTPFDDPGMTA